MLKQSKRRMMQRLLLLAATLFVVWCVVAWGAARWLIANNAKDAGRHERDIEVIAVLAGSADYLARTRHAARIWKENPSARVVLTDDGERSGWLSSEGRNPFFVERARWALEEAGVFHGQIEQLPQIVSSTHDEVVLLRDYAARREVRSMTVVTSAYHMRRASWVLRRVFERSGVIVAVDAATPDDLTPASSAWWLSARGWRVVAGEYPKLAYYYFQY